jgi:hypothetical protein
MTVDENTSTGDTAQPMDVWIDPDINEPSNEEGWQRVGKDRKPKSPPRLTGTSTRRNANPIPMDIDNGPSSLQQAASIIQQGNAQDDPKSPTSKDATLTQSSLPDSSIATTGGRLQDTEMSDPNTPPTDPPNDNTTIRDDNRTSRANVSAATSASSSAHASGGTKTPRRKNAQDARSPSRKEPTESSSKPSMAFKAVNIKFSVKELQGLAGPFTAHQAKITELMKNTGGLHPAVPPLLEVVRAMQKRYNDDVSLYLLDETTKITPSLLSSMTAETWAATFEGRYGPQKGKQVLVTALVRMHNPSRNWYPIKTALHDDLHKQSIHLSPVAGGVQGITKLQLAWLVGAPHNEVDQTGTLKQLTETWRRVVNYKDSTISRKLKELVPHWTDAAPIPDMLLHVDRVVSRQGRSVVSTNVLVILIDRKWRRFGEWIITHPDFTIEHQPFQLIPCSLRSQPMKLHKFMRLHDTIQSSLTAYKVINVSAQQMQTVMLQCKSIDGFHSIIRTPTTESRGKWKVMLKRDNLNAALPQLDEILSNLPPTPSIFPGKPHRLNIGKDDRWARPDYIEVCEAQHKIPSLPDSVWKQRPNIRADATVATQDSSQTNTSINDFKAEVYRAIQQCMENTQNVRVELNTRIDEYIKPQMQDTDLKVSNLADNITTLSDKLDTQLHATNERFSSVNARIQEVDDKLNNRMEQQFNRHKEEMQAMMQRIEDLLLKLPSTMALQFGPTFQHTQHTLAPDSALEHDPPSDESNRAKRPKPSTPGRGRTGSFNGHASSPHGPPTEEGPSTPQPME